ncbi:MAG: hypothetical protein ACI8RD_005254, partial [Bacillariaceae sp.]
VTCFANAQSDETRVRYVKDHAKDLRHVLVVLKFYPTITSDSHTKLV